VVTTSPHVGQYSTESSSIQSPHTGHCCVVIEVASVTRWSWAPLMVVAAGGRAAVKWWAGSRAM
jgi:hypothetical protein